MILTTSEWWDLHLYYFAITAIWIDFMYYLRAHKCLMKLNNFVYLLYFLIHPIYNTLHIDICVERYPLFYTGRICRIKTGRFTAVLNTKSNLNPEILIRRNHCESLLVFRGMIKSVWIKPFQFSILGCYGTEEKFYKIANYR